MVDGVDGFKVTVHHFDHRPAINVVGLAFEFEGVLVEVDLRSLFTLGVRVWGTDPVFTDGPGRLGVADPTLRVVGARPRAGPGVLPGRRCWTAAGEDNHQNDDDRDRDGHDPTSCSVVVFEAWIETMFSTSILAHGYTPKPLPSCGRVSVVKLSTLGRYNNLS